MFLLDTSILAALREAKMSHGDEKLAAWFARVPGDNVYISAITIQELQIAIQRVYRRNAHQAVPLQKWMSGNIMKYFRDRIIPIEVSIASRSAMLQVERSRPIPEAIIAATAYVRQVTLVTRYPSEYADAQIKVVSPWDRNGLLDRKPDSSKCSNVST